MKTIALWILGIVGTLILGWIGKLMYGVFLQDTETMLKGRLARVRSLSRHKRYVRAFVGAMRGRAEQNDAAIRAGLVLFVAICVTLFAFFSGLMTFHTLDYSSEVTAHIDGQMREINEHLASYEAKLQTTFESKKTVTALDKQDSKLTPTTLPDALEIQEAKIAERREHLVALRGELQEIRDRAFESAESLGSMRIPVTLAFLVLLSITIFLSFVWIPIMFATRVFAFETSRFMVRIQSIATPEEVGRLARAEVAVADERSLRAFVGLAVTIARAHDIAPLALRFDLWDSFGTTDQTGTSPAA